MQKLSSLVRTFSSLPTHSLLSSFLQSSTNTLQPGRSLLTPLNPMVNSSCGFKVKGHVKRRCKSCYIVIRDERIYNICPTHPRHKQMSMKPKPLTTYVLTHATQGKVRPW